jgi:hypothetical protein
VRFQGETENRIVDRTVRVEVLQLSPCACLSRLSHIRTPRFFRCFVRSTRCRPATVRSTNGCTPCTTDRRATSPMTVRRKCAPDRAALTRKALKAFRKSTALSSPDSILSCSSTCRRNRTKATADPPSCVSRLPFRGLASASAVTESSLAVKVLYTNLSSSISNSCDFVRSQQAVNELIPLGMW